MTDGDPSTSELEILQVLWELGSASVREIHARMERRRPVGYTTTLKQLQRMLDKGFVERLARREGETGRGHRYRATLRPRKTRGALLDRVVDTAFDGSSSALVMHALGRWKPSAGEIDEIRALLDELDER